MGELLNTTDGLVPVNQQNYTFIWSASENYSTQVVVYRLRYKTIHSFGPYSWWSTSSIQN